MAAFPNVGHPWQTTSNKETAMNEHVADDLNEMEDELTENGEKELTPEERLKAALETLIYDKGWSPRKARRYLESQARRTARSIKRKGSRLRDHWKKTGMEPNMQATADQIRADLEMADVAVEAVNEENRNFNYTPATKEF